MPDDTDPRFSLANERTFLAWIRTALGLLAAGAGVVALNPPWPEGVERGVGALLAVTGAGAAVIGWTRWRNVEAAIAAGIRPPPLRAHGVLVLVVGLIAAVVAVQILF